MKTWMTWVAGALVLGLLAGVYAQETPKKEGEKARIPSAWGKVVSLDKEAKTLTASVSTKRGEEPKEMVFAFTDATKVILAGETRGEGKPGTIDDVKADVRVSILYLAGEGDAKPMALSIRIMREGAGGGPKKAE